MRQRELTPRRRRIVQVIEDSVRRNGYAPSMREIGEAAGLASTSSVAYQLSVLEKEGYLSREARRPRTAALRTPPCGHRRLATLTGGRPGAASRADRRRQPDSRRPADRGDRSRCPGNWSGRASSSSSPSSATR